METVETFTIVRDYAPTSMGSTLWAGFIHAYAAGDVALHLQTIYDDTPATRAGMVPAKHEGSIIIAVNGESCYEEAEDERDDQAIRANDAFERLTKGTRIKDPFILTIRQPTHDEVRKSLLPRIVAVLDTALGRDWQLPSGTTLAGRDLLRFQGGVDMLRRTAGIEERDLMKMSVFVEEITKRGWQGSSSFRLSFVASGTPDSLQEMTQAIQAEFPDAELTTFRQRISAKEEALSIEKKKEFQALLAAAHPDEPVREGQDPCVVCLSNVRRVALLHDKTAHLCVCNGCAMVCGYWKLCPVCRLPVDATRQISDTDDDSGTTVYGKGETSRRAASPGQSQMCTLAKKLSV